MLTELIHDIEGYICYLKSLGLYISIHDKSNYFFNYMYIMSKYNLHNSAFCLTVKSDPAAWNRCIECQEKVYKRLEQGAFFGMCHAGVEEFVFPIKTKELVGFVSVSGYGIDAVRAQKKIRRLCDEYILDYNKMLDIYNTSLIHSPADFTKLCTIINPLCHMLSLLCERLKDYLPKAADNSNDYIYSRAVTYLNKNFSSDLNLSDISRYCNCSTSSLSHIFKKRSGVSISAYITRLRLENAKILLRDTAFPIKDISLAIGYNDPNYFTNCFKKEFKISPKDFRKSHQKDF